MQQIEAIRKKLAYIKNENVWLRWLWTEYLRLRGKLSLWKYSDREAIRRMYHKEAGRYPDLDKPALFSEKLQWMKLHYIDSEMRQCADKYAVRDYLRKKGYGDLLNDLIGIYEDTAAIKVAELPQRFVLKCSHGSGWNMICRDKDNVHWLPWRLLMRCWLKYDYFMNGREAVYRGAKPRIVCEEYLEDASGGLTDFKFYCFMGEPRFVQVNIGRGSREPVQNFYDLDWKLQPFGKGVLPTESVEIPPPANLDEMVRVARDLSSPFPFVRVDLYNVDGKICFGEFTFFPDSGRPNFTAPEFDATVGEMLVLPEKPA
jgi:hypothetical protein